MAKPKFRSSVKGGLLFKAEARVDFLTITGRKFDDMQKRAKKHGLELPFTKDQLRADILSVLSGGKKDGCVECRYCHGMFVVSEIAADHAVAFSKGGSLGLENLDYPCINCNRAKGPMTPAQFLKLIDFLERELPDCRTDILGRLSKAISLAVAARRAQSKLRQIEGASQIHATGQVAKALPLNFDHDKPF